MGAPRYLERVILGEERGVVSWMVRAVLWPFSVVYRIGLAAYLCVYSSGLRKRHRLSVPVISVGNLTFGGTGKTPAVQTLCRVLAKTGKRVVVLSRGHGRNTTGTLLVSDGKSVLADADQAGDEPVLLARTLPGFPVVVGKDRRESGELACSRFKPDVIVLDDGMQFWQLERDLDIALMDARRPFGSGIVMPAGDLREPVSGLARAGVILVNNAFGLSDADYGPLLDRLKALAPSAHVFRCGARASELLSADGSARHSAEELENKSVLAFCGIGRPESFFETLGLLGAHIEKKIAFADHHRFSDSDLRMIEGERKACGAEAAVTTEKDMARIGGQTGIEGLCALSIRLEIEDIQSFEHYVNEAIDR